MRFVCVAFESKVRTKDYPENGIGHHKQPWKPPSRREVERHGALPGFVILGRSLVLTNWTLLGSSWCLIFNPLAGSVFLTRSSAIRASRMFPCVPALCPPIRSAH